MYLQRSLKKKVSEYIYYEIGNMESMRDKTGKRNHAYDHDHIDRCTVFVSDNMEIIEIDFAKH